MKSLRKKLDLISNLLLGKYLEEIALISIDSLKKIIPISQENLNIKRNNSYFSHTIKY